jgi:hypothetical protein
MFLAEHVEAAQPRMAFRDPKHGGIHDRPV